jgi:hypothetical protein
MKLLIKNIFYFKLDFSFCELIAWLQSSCNLNQICAVNDPSSPIRFFKAFLFIIGSPQRIILSEVYESNHQKDMFQISVAGIDDEQVRISNNAFPKR